jgi:LysR family transcriptional regulator, regulator for genes of the gallate degradation pathway
VSTARSGNETVAAATLGVTQPAVHLRLRGLAHLAGTALVRRTDRGVRLTDAGERWAAAAELALSELRMAEEELAGWRGLAVGQLAVGALPMAGTELVPRALGRLLAHLPGVQATVADGTYETLLHLLRHGEIDLVVGPLRGSLAAADIEELVLFVDHLVPVVRAGHPWLARTRAELRRGLLGADWISPLRGSPARAAYEAAFRAAGHEPPAARLHANSPSAVRALLLQSDRVALLSPLQVLSDVAGGVLTVLPLPLVGTERTIGITTRRGGLPSPAGRVFMDELRAVVDELQLNSSSAE